MVVFYSLVVCKLRGKQNQILNREQLAVNRVHKRITFMVITVTMILAATWGAGWAIGISFLTHLGSELQLRHRIWALLFAINLSVNCFLYTLFSSKFRKSFRNMFQVCRKMHKRNEENRHYADKTGENSRSVDETNSKVILETKL